MRDNHPVTSDQIREIFLEFFASRDHKRLASASLVPASHDPSVLLTTAGMHPLKPYFLGQEDPPHHRLTTVQKCFRTPDIDVVGTTSRHLTFFEMLGNFSLGDYFKGGAVEMAWELSLNGFGFDADDIWITVFEGDDELGLGPDEEAIAAWEAVGVPSERIVLCPRSENFWQAGPIGPCGPCSELYLDRGVRFGAPEDLPGGENERFLEFWNLVFMQFNQDPMGTLTPLPNQNIDTGLGLNRMALIQQGTDSIFETDQFASLIALGEELSGKRYAAGAPEVVRGLRILADHTRGMNFLIADGVVPSNEDRGYVLRRIMRRAIQQGHSLGIERGFLPRFQEGVQELMGAAYPELVDRRETITKWLTAEEESFGRTLDQGTRLLDDLIRQAREDGREGIGADDAFRLHDTFGFPFDLTKELAAEQDLGVDPAGFTALMDQQRARSAGGAKKAGRVGAEVDIVRALGEPAEFTGYGSLEEHTTVIALDEVDGVMYVKLADSPFYATGGGQVRDAGTLVSEDGPGDCAATVIDVVRAGEDQALVVEVTDGTLALGDRVVARVDPAARHAIEANHTATHLLHAALRARLGEHVHQAGSYVGPDKLRFDFTHGTRLSPEELHAVEDEVNERVVENLPVRPQVTTLEEARRLGAMALFGEKYGDVVRMVEIGDGSFSRELCGGTHVRSTAEIGLVKILTESSNAANVRRIEALTGPEAVRYMRRRDELVAHTAAALKTEPERLTERVAALQEQARKGAKAGAGSAVDPEALAARATRLDGAVVLTEVVPATEPKALLDLADRVKGKLSGDAAIVLGTAAEGRVHLVAAVAPELVQRGVKAGAIVKAAAQVAGGGGGGRDTVAQAGGRDPEKLPEAIAAARAAIEAALSGPPVQ
jgi:alanyl-tRNA synthetase